MDRTPLMPKATAVWLVENTSLTFEQIAEFCGLHVLEVKGIADGDVAQGIKGMDPISSGQLTREEIAPPRRTPHRLKLAEPKVDVPEVKTKGPRYTPVSRRQDRPNAVLWLCATIPSSRTARSCASSARPSRRSRDPRAQPLELAQPAAAGPGDARAVLADRPRCRGEEGGGRLERERKEAGKVEEGRHAAARRGDRRGGARSPSPSARWPPLSPGGARGQNAPEEEEESARYRFRLRQAQGSEAHRRAVGLTKISGEVDPRSRPKPASLGRIDASPSDEVRHEHDRHRSIWQWCCSRSSASPPCSPTIHRPAPTRIQAQRASGPTTALAGAH